MTAGVIIGGSALLNNNGTGLGDYFTFGSDSNPISNADLDEFEKALINADEAKLLELGSASGSDRRTQDNIVICNAENQISRVDPVTGEVICIDADVVETDCVWLDGEAYNLWDIKTQYKVAIKDAEHPNPECEEASFTCVNGLYITTAEDASEYNRTECITIEPEEEELITCTWDGEEYLPSEVRYNFVKTKVEQTSECRFVGFYCNGHGEWRSEFEKDIYSYEECTFTEALDDEYMTVYTNELLDRWLLTESDAGELVVINDTFAVQNEGESCFTPWEEEIAHGESVLSFEDETWAWDDECVVRTSQCDNGVFVEKVPFDYPSCRIEKPESCEINGYELFHDTRKIFYKYGKYVNGKWVCDEQERYCFDGEADGDVAYKYTTCTPPAAPGKKVEYNAANAVCPSPYVGGWSSRRPDQTGVGYYESSVAYGWTCSSVNLVCKFGTIRIGNATNYGGSIGQKFHTACNVGTPNGCSFNFIDAGTENVAHGWTIGYYATATVWFGKTCAKLTASCSNGALSVASGYATCAPKKPAACTSPCGNTAHGKTLTTYNYASLPYGDGVTSCAAVGNAVVTSTCKNGSLSPAPAGNCSCTVQAPVGCSNGMSHGQTITRFNDPWCSADQFGNDLDGWSNSACQCKYGSITCNNGSLSKTANYPGDGFPTWSCG